MAGKTDKRRKGENMKKFDAGWDYYEKHRAKKKGKATK